MMTTTNSGTDLLSQLLLQLNNPSTRQDLLSRLCPTSVNPSPQNRPLPNDTCPETIEAEQRFVTHLGLLPIQNIEIFDNHEDQLVLHSRALGNQYFILPANKYIDVSQHLRPHFDKLGHTLTIVIGYSWRLPLLIDIDCMCRVRGNIFGSEHISSQFIKEICTKLKEMGYGRVSVWQRETCGVHIYNTDLKCVSLPTLVDIVQQLSSHFHNREVKFEVPINMPLPYSAKFPKMCYLPHGPFINFSIQINRIRDQIFIEQYEFNKENCGDMSKIRISTVDGEVFYLNRKRKVTMARALPKFPLPLIDLFVNRDNGWQFVRSYLENMVKNYTKQSHCEVDNSITSTLSGPNEIIVGTVKTCLVWFNKTFSDSNNDESYSLFVHKSLEDHMLQHYIVALHKCVMTELKMSMTTTLFNDFKSTITSMYSHAIPNNKVLARYLKYYTRETYNAYTVECGYVMFQHMRYRDKYNIKSNMSTLDVLNTILCRELCKEKPEDYRLEYHEKGAPKDLLISSFLNSYIPALIELRILMYGDRLWFMIERGCFYTSHKNLNNVILPALTAWLGPDDKVAKNVHNTILAAAADFTVADTDLFTHNNDFLIATEVGVFNSITGLYTATTRFLRYYRYRRMAVWPKHNESTCDTTIYPEVNENVLDYQEKVTEYVHFLRNNTHKIFLHFIFAPAMFQLTKVEAVVEERTEDFIHILGEFVPKLIPDAFFIAECFAINERMIYTMLYVNNTFPNKFLVFLDYEKLAQLVFGRHCNLETTGGDVQTTTSYWKDWYLTNLDPKFSYDSSAESYMDRIRSIKGLNVDAKDEDDETLFTIIMLAVVLLKRNDFKMFTRAFGYSDGLLNLKKEMPAAYAKDFDFTVNSSTFVSNLNRAKMLLFSEEKLQDPFTEAIVNSICSVCMSTYFNQERTCDAFNILSALYVMHNQHKKLFVLYGAQHTGKSAFANYIRIMASPQCCIQSDLKEHLRTGMGGVNNVVILNEMRDLNFDIVKMITGNDSASIRKFHTQEFMHHDKQALIYSCTNVVPINRSGERQVADTDTASIDRFHAVQFVGAHVTNNVYFSSLYHMMLDKVMYKSHSPVLNVTANCMNWLAFVNYYEYRDKATFYIPLEISSSDSVTYRDRIRYNNNKLYKFLFHCGLRSEKQFNISYANFKFMVEQHITQEKQQQCLEQEDCEGPLTLLPVVAASNDALKRRRQDKSSTLKRLKADGSYINSMAEFNRRFFEDSGIDLKLKPNTIRNYHCVEVIDHIKQNMSVLCKDDGVITMQDIDRQLFVYLDRNIKTNASDYFQRFNCNTYSNETRTFQGIVFKYEPIEFIHFLNVPASRNMANIEDNVPSMGQSIPPIRPMDKQLLENATMQDIVA